ncbi:GIY-YIG catalytic domain-containing endonuclease [Paramecium bursaria Chlorella virus NYs1]|uniref:GIY-YIG catalytic domain-containing endonuclease n=1 Tax=Paramecium bursaria Chlorella virus NYs1 TaxID=83442 RepID=M1I355_9PHYC|nr:GIY-YIG catalytic domain-containing endonuclease [Paramecium bursaria Chlorella virus NYs1]AGE54176.1 GIY-YIG catalytic domain-containing endonuclease [Paramecium bursaria Chlorella virus IL-5-2s1]AGE58672.1 GIY-YIG catalytic domain-containing endonuclease [Paramecium bursaria Chlorella virus NYs1]
MGFIYVKTSPSGKSYIGQTMRTLEERFEEHQKESSGCTAFAAAIKKHGWENFITDYYECPDDELNKHETWLITLMGTLSPGGYNLTEGGKNRKPSEETRKRMSEAHIGKELTGETKKKMSESRSGENNHMYGKTHTEETKQRMIEAQTGKTHSDETKQKMSEAQKGEKNSLYGKKHTEEAKKKMSESKKGNLHMMGKQHTEESKKKQSENNPNAKKVYQYDLDGKYIQWFNSLRKAGKHIGKHTVYISRCVRGEREDAHGFRWSYDFIPDLSRWANV